MRFRTIALWSACLMLSMAISLPSTAGASNDSATTYDVPSTIDAKGTHDVTAQLLAFIASVPDGSTIVFPANARYRIDASLLIEGRNGLTFEGNGAEFFAATDADRNRRHWWIKNSKDIIVRDVVVRGANPNAGTGEDAYRTDREAQHGFDLAGVENVVIERVTVTDVYGDFVYVGRGKRGWSQSVTVRDSRFERNGRQGVAITAGQDIRIERNFISDVRRSTIDIEPNGAEWGARRVTIVNNDIGPGRLNFIAGHGYAAPVADIAVIGNRLNGKTMNISLKAPASQRRSNFSLIGNISNTSFSSTLSAVTIDGFDGVMIRDNILPVDASRNMTAVSLLSTCGAVMSNNDFKGAARDVSSDGYVCAKTSVGTTAPVAANSSTTRVSSTTVRPGGSVSPATRSDGAVVDNAIPGTRGATPLAEDAEQDNDEPAAASPDEGTAAPYGDGRLVDPVVNRDGSSDYSFWVLGIGAVISAMVLVPLSMAGRRRSRRP